MSIIVFDFAGKKQAIIQHMPKTGGNSVKAILQANNIKFEEIHAWRRAETPYINSLLTNASLHYPLTPYDMSALTFLRDPVSWYISYFAYRIMHAGKWSGWQMSRQFDRKCNSNDFSEFIRKVQYHYPRGFLKHLCAEYREYSTHIGYTETLYEDLLWFIKEQLDIKLKTPDKCLNFSENKPMPIDSDIEIIREIEGEL